MAVHFDVDDRGAGKSRYRKGNPITKRVEGKLKKFYHREIYLESLKSFGQSRFLFNIW